MYTFFFPLLLLTKNKNNFEAQACGSPEAPLLVKETLAQAKKIEAGIMGSELI